VQQAIATANIGIGMVAEDDIRAALREIYQTQGLLIEPSSAITLAYVQAHAAELPQPICVILTGQNITREDHHRVAGLFPPAAAGGPSIPSAP